MGRWMIHVLCLGLACLAPGRAAAQTEQVYYYHLDAVGSVRMITDANGQEVERADYTPFGQPSLTGSVQDPRQFTGQPYDAESAFQYAGARYYQSQTGRFTSPDDPSYLDPSDPQSFNRYAYAYNNPLRYNDPTGHAGDCVAGYDPTTHTCTPAGLDASTLQFFWESSVHFAQQFVQQATQAAWGYLTAPRDFGCWGGFAAGGATAGASAGLAGVAGGPTVALSVPTASAFGAVTGSLVGATACMSSAGDGGGGGGKASGEQGSFWKQLKPFRGKTKTNGLSGGARRFFERDYTHGDIEVYDATGRHLGSADPETGAMTKPAVPGRRITI